MTSTGGRLHPLQGEKLAELLSPQSPAKNPALTLTGPSRNGYLSASSFISYIEQWHSLQLKGIKVCRSIQAIKLHEIIGAEFPTEMAPMSETLTEITDTMAEVLKSMHVVNQQLKALAELIPGLDPLFNTWPATKLSAEISSLFNMFKSETEIKIIVKENISHCRNEYITEVYSSAWEYNTAINPMILNLFLEESNIS